jgi:hypothetical protein
LALHASIRVQDFVPFAIIVLLGTAWFVLPIYRLGAYVRTAAEATSYSRAIDELERGAEPACVKRNECIIDRGPPNRIAFVWHGIVDNWVGIVYDPKDAVSDAKKYQGLFGGDLLSCTHLWAHYFLCAFT